MTMTREYAIQEGFISPTSNHIDEERKCPYIRITEWYAPDEERMARNAFSTLRGTDSLLIVSDNRQALYRHQSQLKLDFEY